MVATSAQLHSAGTMDLRVIMSDSDAKIIMAKTPNVKLTVGSQVICVYEVNPTVLVNVYAVRLYSPVKNSIAVDETLTFEV